MPGQHSRSRSPLPPRRREGRRPGARREGGERAGRGGGERVARDGRPKKTQEELDAEMEDYWGAKAKENDNEAAPVVTAEAPIDDVEMIS